VRCAGNLVFRKAGCPTCAAPITEALLMPWRESLLDYLAKQQAL